MRNDNWFSPMGAKLDYYRRARLSIAQGVNSREPELPGVGMEASTTFTDALVNFPLHSEQVLLGASLADGYILSPTYITCNSNVGSRASYTNRFVA